MNMQEDFLKSINVFCVFNLHHMDTAGVFTRDSQAQVNINYGKLKMYKVRKK
jgi:hypothetical protein